MGDRVKTSYGIGTIVEINGEQYLVALDGQEARLWEKTWGLKRVCISLLSVAPDFYSLIGN